MQIELEILSEYIRNELGYKGSVDPEADLLDAKILDSFNIIEMAMFIQNRFNVEFEAEDLVRSNLGTLNAMIALINSRRPRTSRLSDDAAE